MFVVVIIDCAEAEQVFLGSPGRQTSPAALVVI